jgi:hypothetical protein
MLARQPGYPGIPGLNTAVSVPKSSVFGDLDSTDSTAGAAKAIDRRSDNQNTSRAWYSATIANFLRQSAGTIVERLTTHCDFTELSAQRDA